MPASEIESERERGSKECLVLVGFSLCIVIVQLFEIGRKMETRIFIPTLLTHTQSTQLNAHSVYSSDSNDFELWKSFCAIVSFRMSRRLALLYLNRCVMFSLRFLLILRLLMLFFCFLFFSPPFLISMWCDVANGCAAIIWLISLQWWWKIHSKLFKYRASVGWIDDGGSTSSGQPPCQKLFALEGSLLLSSFLLFTRSLHRRHSYKQVTHHPIS